MRGMRCAAGLLASAVLAVALSGCGRVGDGAERRASGSPGLARAVPQGPEASGGAGKAAVGDVQVEGASGAPSRGPRTFPVDEDVAGLGECSTADLDFRLGPMPDRAGVLLITAIRREGRVCVMPVHPVLSSDGLRGRAAERPPRGPVERVVLAAGERAYAAYTYRKDHGSGPTYPMGRIHLTFLRGTDGRHDPVVTLVPPIGLGTDESASVTAWVPMLNKLY